MTMQAFNPILPSWEYIPDGEPYVFGDRVYLYGSHDRFNSHMYCLNDYVCWSAPIDDLGNWRYEGVIYERTADPENPDGSSCLYAPDVTVGADGRYYLYYVLHELSIVSVAVCDTPAGQYSFYGYVHYEDGTRLGEKASDEAQFDPAVLYEDGQVYLYTGFCLPQDTSRTGAMVTILDSDMLTVKQAPQIVVPSKPFSEESSFQDHAFFEAPSIRKIDDWYYFIYSSEKMYELCYATSKSPLHGFTYGGVLISNNDMGIAIDKPADVPTYYGGNNHGSIVEINNDWYVFYHRHTNGTNFSRQACAEKIKIEADASIKQVEMSSCGLSKSPLPASGTYHSYIASALFCDEENPYTGGMGKNGLWMDAIYPKITQDGKDGDEEIGYILNMTNSATAGFKNFDGQHVDVIKIHTRGYGRGVFEVRNSIKGDILCEIPVNFSSVWKESYGILSTIHSFKALYFTFRGEGNLAFHSFRLE